MYTNKFMIFKNIFWPLQIRRPSLHLPPGGGVRHPGPRLAAPQPPPGGDGGGRGGGWGQKRFHGRGEWQCSANFSSRRHSKHCDSYVFLLKSSSRVVFSIAGKHYFVKYDN